MTDTWACEHCETIWNSQAAADRCDCEQDNLTASPSRHRLSYRLSYD